MILRCPARPTPPLGRLSDLLGSGKRLFRDADETRRLRLVDSKTTSTGGLILTYQLSR